MPILQTNVEIANGSWTMPVSQANVEIANGSWTMPVSQTNIEIANGRGNACFSSKCWNCKREGQCLFFQASVGITNRNWTTPILQARADWLAFLLRADICLGFPLIS